MNKYKLRRIAVRNLRARESQGAPHVEDIVKKVYHCFSRPFFLSQDDRRDFFSQITRKAILPYAKFYARATGVDYKEISQLLKLEKSALIDYLVYDNNFPKFFR